MATQFKGIKQNILLIKLRSQTQNGKIAIRRKKEEEIGKTEKTFKR